MGATLSTRAWSFWKTRVRNFRSTRWPGQILARSCSFTEISASRMEVALSRRSAPPPDNSDLPARAGYGVVSARPPG